MMFWVQESKDKHSDLDSMYLMQELDSDRQEYIQLSESSIRQLDISQDPRYYESIIPVGNLKFVQTALSKIHGIDHMNPIEVPEILRRYEFLKRKYSILRSKDLPKEGYYFVKNASKLKDFSYTGEISYIHEGPKNEYCVHFNDSDLYQLSEAVSILSEYRVFVHHDEIIGIHHYDGDCTIFPQMGVVLSMISTYCYDDSRPRAYTMDIAIIRDRGTALIEIHPWVSVGLYGYIFSESLPYCYRDGFRYYVEVNKPIKEYKEG